MELSPLRPCCRVVAAFFVLTVALRAPADPLILHAHACEKAGDPEASAALLSMWLASNPGASGSPEVFASYFQLEQDLHALLEASRHFLVSARGVPGAAFQFDRIARLLDLSGRTEEARNAYLAAFAEGSSESALVTAFLLSYQMNDAESMSEALKKLGGKGGSADLFLHALSAMRTGDRAEARTALIGVADQTGNPELALKALWILYQAEAKSGNPAAGAWSRSRLGSRFASAPETAIVAGPAAPGTKAARAVVVEMPTPVVMDAASSTSNPGVAPAVVQAAPNLTPPSPSAMAKFSVQAGSFLMKENTDDLVSELSKRGFAPTVLHETVQGKDRYRVLAGTGLEAEGARALLKKLSDAGFSGFIVTDR
jgi:cell division septation protein DedD